MQIDWSKIVTNAVSILVAATFVGAATLVWQSAVNQEHNIKSEVEHAKLEVLAMQQELNDKLTILQTNLVQQIALVASRVAEFDEIMTAAHLKSDLSNDSEASPPQTGAVPRMTPEEEKELAQRPVIAESKAEVLNLQIQRDLQVYDVEQRKAVIDTRTQQLQGMAKRR